MFRNYFNITYRLFLRNKAYSFINVFGLAMGLAVFILILLFIRHELGYDTFYEDNERIYRVTRSWYNDDGEESLHLARVAPPIGPLLEQDYPHLLEEVVRINQWGPILKIGEERFEGENLFLAEDNFFRVFSTKLISGDPETVLTDPGSIVISERIARQYFDTIDPMGKTIEIVGIAPMIVSGVFEDVPVNTHFEYDILVPFVALEMTLGVEALMRDWSSNNYLTYVKFFENIDPEQLAGQLDDFIDRNYAAYITEVTGREIERPLSEGTKLHLQKLTDIHLNSHLSTELEPNGDIRTVRIFSLVAVFILLIASINFINLSTARSAKRAKEVALRKVGGASRSKLIVQFLAESMFFTLLALVIAIVTVDLVLPAFSNFISADLSFSEGGRLSITLLLLVIGLLMGILSGMYPAFYLSRFKPVRVLRSAFRPGKATTPLRTILVITQFAISIALIISIGIINKQLKYIQETDTGFNRENVLIFNAGGDILGDIETFKARLLENPRIEGVSSSQLIPSNDLINNWGGRTLDGENPGPIPFRLAVVSVDYDFFENLEIEVLAGRDFSREYSMDDSTSFILNAVAVKELGWGEPQDAIDRPILYGGIRGTCIGVVDDINFESLYNKVAPVIYVVQSSRNYRISLKLAEEDITSTLEYIESIYYEYNPNGLFYYFFLDEAYKDNYRTEFQLGKVMVLFTIFAIIIACLGLFGLSSFLSELKSKEVGIRKVMGSSILQVVRKLSLEFTRWVLAANLIAWPAAWILMERWLGNFAYRIEMPWLVFLLAVIVSMGIAILTVSFQAIRSGLRNPVDSIRYE